MLYENYEKIINFLSVTLGEVKYLESEKPAVVPTYTNIENRLIL